MKLAFEGPISLTCEIRIELMMSYTVKCQALNYSAQLLGNEAFSLFMHLFIYLICLFHTQRSIEKETNEQTDRQIDRHTNRQRERS